MRMPLLDVQELVVRLGKAEILRGVTLSVDRGELVGLIGANGAGKTTTLRAISGMIPRRGLHLTLDGQPIPGEAYRVARMGISHVPEGRGLLTSLTVRDNLQLACMAVGKPFSRSVVTDLLTAFPQLEGLIHRYPDTLSGGERQLVAIARGLVVDPRVLMVDELSFGLAPKAVSQVAEALVAACRLRSTALLLVDQNVSTVASTCRRIYVLSAGRTSQPDRSAMLEESAREVYFG